MLPIYGKPDRNYKDEDDNVILPTTQSKLLTFYKEEDFRL
jgi:hypothetical protein